MVLVNTSNNWEKVKYRYLRYNFIRLQIRIYKAIQLGHISKARCLQKLALTSYSAKILALNERKQLSLNLINNNYLNLLIFKKKLQLEKNLKENLNTWRCKETKALHFFRMYKYKFMKKIYNVAKEIPQDLIAIGLGLIHELLYSSKTYTIKNAYGSNSTMLSILFLRNLKFMLT